MVHEVPTIRMVVGLEQGEPVVVVTHIQGGVAESQYRREYRGGGDGFLSRFGAGQG